MQSYKPACQSFLTALFQILWDPVTDLNNLHSQHLLTLSIIYLAIFRQSEQDPTLN